MSEKQLNFLQVKDFLKKEIIYKLFWACLGTFLFFFFLEPTIRFSSLSLAVKSLATMNVREWILDAICFLVFLMASFLTAYYLVSTFMLSKKFGRFVIVCCSIYAVLVLFNIVSINLKTEPAFIYGLLIKIGFIGMVLALILGMLGLIQGITFFILGKTNEN